MGGIRISQVIFFRQLINFQARLIENQKHRSNLRSYQHQQTNAHDQLSINGGMYLNNKRENYYELSLKLKKFVMEADKESKRRNKNGKITLGYHYYSLWQLKDLVAAKLEAKTI